VKLKVNNRILAVVAVIALIAVALLVRGSMAGDGDAPPKAPLDAAAVKACDDFASGYPKAKSQAARLRLADVVLQSTMDTENDPIADRASELGRDADDDKQWRAHASALTDACKSSGWTR
jgi:hypothetical protein